MKTNQVSDPLCVPPPDDLIGQFNYIFQGDAKATIKNGELLITIGNRTMVIQLPIVSGAQSKAQSHL